MKLSKIMDLNPLTLHPGQTIEDAAKLFFQHHVNSATVIDEEGKLTGFFTDRQIYKVIKDKKDFSTPVGDVMITGVFTGSPDDCIEDFRERCSSVGSIPVTDAGRLVGIVGHMEIGQAFYYSLKEKASELDAIINSTHNLIVAVDKNCRITLFNKACEKVFDRPAREVIGKDVRDIVPHSGLPHIVENGRKEPAQKILLEGNPFLTNLSPIYYNGEIIGAVAVLQDISDLESIAGELEHYKDLNNELEKIIECSYDGLFITDGQGVVLRANQAFERITGNKRNDCLGRSMKELEPGRVKISVTRLVLEKRESVTIVQESLNGKMTLTTGNPIFDEEGNIIKVVTNVRDLTELEEMKHKIEEMEDLSQLYKKQLRTLRLQYTGSNKFVTNSPKMKNILEKVIRLAQFDSTILITGESGTGKELVAELIHDNNNRKHSPFIKVNCGAIPENLLESELFGYDYGAFTGAKKSGKSGYFQMANGGTIFLDEIGDLPYNLQVKILRVLQEREIVRVGGEKSLPIDVRVITATNRNLLEMVEKKQFRGDLFYRLNVIPVVIPPLRERIEDIPALIKHFTEIFNKKYRLAKTFSPEVMEKLIAYDWPGNVRELQNLVENLLVTSIEDVISGKDLPPRLLGDNSTQLFISGIIPLQDAIDTVEKQLVEKAYTQYRTTRQMAEALKVSAATIVRKAAKYGISK
ncbi:MAG TPA: sigma 54-interacting transcriptional regulator [Syntrophomonadaceae bacterium]|nr:sigma 54-interacting transcriptional regulator [Syntrophomonadaceae bacterium]